MITHTTCQTHHTRHLPRYTPPLSATHRHPLPHTHDPKHHSAPRTPPHLRSPQHSTAACPTTYTWTSHHHNMNTYGITDVCCSHNTYAHRHRSLLHPTQARALTGVTATQTSTIMMRVQVPLPSQQALGIHPPLTEQVPQTLHAADPALTRVPVYATRSVRVTHAHSHTQAASLCFAPSSDPESRAVLSAQCPVSWSHGCQPDASLLAPEVTAPLGDGRGPSLGGPGSRRAGFCPGCALTITVITMPCLAPCPSGNLQPVTSIVPLPFLGRGRQGWGRRGVGGSPQVSRALSVRPSPG